MKEYEDKVVLPIKWTFCSDGQTLRSTVIGGFQAEIQKSVLRIYSNQGQMMCGVFCSSRRVGMLMARNRIARLINGQY